MAKMRGTVTLFFAVFFDCSQDSNSEFVSRSKNLSEELPKIFDKILLQVFSKAPHDPVNNGTRTTAKATTKSLGNKGYSQERSWNNIQFDASSNNPGKHFAKVFDEILLQEFSKVPQDTVFDETSGTAAKSTTKRNFKEKTSVTENPLQLDNLYGNVNSEVNDENISPTHDPLYTPSHKENSLQSRQRTVEEKSGKNSSLFNRDLNEEVTTPESEYEAEVHSENPPCAETLHFLQKNIAIAAAIVAAILVTTVSVVLFLMSRSRNKQTVVPPGNMTYNIFIMTGKTWWQKTDQENKDFKTHTEKEINWNATPVSNPVKT